MNDYERRASEGVPRTVFAAAKKPFGDSECCPYIRYSIKTADPLATDSARELLRFLHDAAARKAFLFGHQNAGHHGVSITAKDGSDSDVKRISGSHPAVVGIDALSLTGYEGNFDDTVRLTRRLHDEKVILTLSMHAPNFAVCGDDFAGYSPNVTKSSSASDIMPEGDQEVIPAVALRIMPGGDLNAKYTRYLDLVADYANACRDGNGEPIPMIFRPFHENNGSWFWWGADFMTPYEYKDLFRYTIVYLREEKGIHHFLYAYSPNGPFSGEADYLERYPGDDYIDIIGFDMYHDRPAAEDGWTDSLVRTARLVSGIARDRHKAAAVTESGIRMLDTAADGHMYEGLSPTDNPRPDWFMECLDAVMNDPLASGIAYFLVWANFSKEQFWVPYALGEARGHEMIDPFTEFLNDPRVILARELSEI